MEKVIVLPENDFDLTIVTPTGKTITIQSRPSNGDGPNYAGSLDIILPQDEWVTCWKGENMEHSDYDPKISGVLTQQLVLTL